MVARSRAHIVRVTAPTGTTTEEVFNLVPQSRLQHLELGPNGTSDDPLRVIATLIQPRADPNIFSRLTGGWIRGSATGPAAAHALTWDGDLEIDTDMALRFSNRNDTGSTATLRATFLVVE